MPPHTDDDDRAFAARCSQLAEELEETRDLIAELDAQRTDAVERRDRLLRESAPAGMTRRAAARHSGLTGGRVQQIVDATPSALRALDAAQHVSLVIDGGEQFEGVVAELQGEGYVTVIGGGKQQSIEHSLVQELVVYDAPATDEDA